MGLRQVCMSGRNACELSCRLQYSSHSPCVRGNDTLPALFSAIVDEASEVVAQIFAVNDHVNKAMIQDELGGLKALGQLGLGGVPNDPGAGKANQGAGLGNSNIT